jgi:hypothetical protein
VSAIPVLADHYDSLTDAERAEFDAWREHVGVPVGTITELQLHEGQVRFSEIRSRRQRLLVGAWRVVPADKLPPRRIFDLALIDRYERRFGTRVGS